MAKTQYSLSDDPTLLGRPTDFVIHIREFIPKLGAGFVVALTGDVMTMPGLPKNQRHLIWMSMKMGMHKVYFKSKSSKSGRAAFGTFFILSNCYVLCFQLE